ncbi:unnamed protein product [Coregonus sp. 'balchen']|nr:unnamed protein product [Coregonus sp. 'balchen']
MTTESTEQAVLLFLTERRRGCVVGTAQPYLNRENEMGAAVSAEMTTEMLVINVIHLKKTQMHLIPDLGLIMTWNQTVIIMVLTEDTISDYTFSGGKVKLRDRRRRESAPAIGTDSGVLAGHVQVRGSRRTSRGSQRATAVQRSDRGRRVGGARRRQEHPQEQPKELNRADDEQLPTGTLDSDQPRLSSQRLLPVECSYPLLILDPSLRTKRDFVMGFSSLHWAAKQGNEELLTQLLEQAK